MKLDELAIKYNTDKQSKDHNYTLIYDQWLSGCRFEIKKLLEIGFGNGSSIRMWNDFFPNTEIFVIEYFGDEYKNLWNSPDVNNVSDRVTVIKGNQSDVEIWKKIPNQLDIVIDDGSHVPEDQIASVMLGFNKLKSRGLWFIEDTHCNFQKGYNDDGDKLYPWIMNLVVRQQIPYLSTMGDFYKIQSLLTGIEKDIFAYHLYKSIIMLERY